MPEGEDLARFTGVLADREMRRLTRRSFITGGVAALAGVGAWTWLRGTRTEGGLPWPLRRALGFNQGLAEGFGAPQKLAPTFPGVTIAGPARINGLVGLSAAVAVTGWQ